MNTPLIAGIGWQCSLCEALEREGEGGGGETKERRELREREE